MVDEPCKVARVVISGGNNWNIVTKKFLYGLGLTFVSIGLPYTINFLQTEDLSGFPVWFIALVPILTGALLALQNAWVHRQKIELVPTEETPPK